MTQIRTDLVYETLLNRSFSKLSGVTSKDITYSGLKVNRIEINSLKAAENLGKSMGKYVTMFCPNVGDGDTEYFNNLVDCLCTQLNYLLPLKGKNILVAGLGNKSITPDALGPLSIKNIVVSRHIKENMESLYNSLNLGELSAVATGVLGQTGIESGEIIMGIAKRLKPDVILAIDSLMASKPSHLGKTIQLSNTGICPGSGVGNHRFEITRETMGVEVISIGVPLVIDAKTLIYSYTGREENLSCDENLVVTPKFIDSLVEKCAKVLGFSINKAVHNNMKIEEMASLLA